MDSRLIEKGFDFARKRKKWILLAAAFGVSGYSLHRVYHSPSVARKRRRLMKLAGALASIAEAVSDSSETISIVSKDLNHFLLSNSDEIPNSIKQISKIAKSSEFSDSVTGVTRALTLGVLHGYNRLSSSGINGSLESPSFTDKVLDKIFSPAGSGFASIVVGSFARSLVMAFYDDQAFGSGFESDSISTWVNLLCDDKVKGMIGDCVQLFVSSAIAVYLEKTMDINTYDEILSGMTNPKHDKKVKDLLVSVCNNAVETLIRTSHDVLSGPTQKGKKSTLAIEEEYSKRKDSYIDDDDYNENQKGWVTKVSSTLAVPRNRKLVLDLTGRVTFETVRSMMEFALEKVCEGMVRKVNRVHDRISDRGREVVRYVSAKSNVITTVCISMCLHILESAWILAPEVDDGRW